MLIRSAIPVNVRHVGRVIIEGCLDRSDVAYLGASEPIITNVYTHYGKLRAELWEPYEPALIVQLKRLYKQNKTVDVDEYDNDYPMVSPA